MKVIKGRIYTKNLVPGKSVYREQLRKFKGIEYREWDYRRSKLGAGIKKGLKNYFKSHSHVLYLGAASGTTVSHLSDLLINGRICAVEFAPEPMKHLVMLAKNRKNIIPIFADANKPEDYKDFVKEVDIVFQDIAQRNQVGIFTKNCKKYLKKKGIGVLTIKSRSIDVTKNPSTVFRNVEKELKKEFHVLQSKRLEPYEKDHKIYSLAMK
jgi:fibrillarin-like pre-rRNA processing protein